jgi:GPI ethanolamine phosphate transferase 1
MGLPAQNQIAGWVLLGPSLLNSRINALQISLVISSITPCITRRFQRTATSKFLTWFLALGSCFTILSISVEGLFYASFSSTLFVWVIAESVVRHDQPPSFKVQPTRKSYEFQADDLRVALFFLFFVQVGFFGTGK